MCSVGGKTIIAGSRTICQNTTGNYTYEILFPYLNLFSPYITEVICGMARGADLCGYHWAKHKGLPVHEFPANWEQYGKSAGYRRNCQMGDYADSAIIFWDGKSNGSKLMMRYMHRLSKPFVLFTIPNPFDFSTYLHE